MKYLISRTLGPNLKAGQIVDFNGMTISEIEKTHGPRETWLTKPHLKGVDDGTEEERTAIFSAEE